MIDKQEPVLMQPKIITFLSFLIFIFTSGLVFSQNSQKPEILDQMDEVRIALSAAPEHLREEAGVWVLLENGYQQIKESGNNFTCIINRDHYLNRKPTCYDAEGTKSILPKVVFFGNLLNQGIPIDQIQEMINEKFSLGEFSEPSRPGVAYMLSDEIRNFNPSTGEVDSFPPHLMFYAPNLNNNDIGAPTSFLPESQWLPFVAYEGEHGFIIVIVE